MSQKALLDEKQLDRTITRISHEIIEKNPQPEDLILIGIHRRGVPLAKRIQTQIESIAKLRAPLGTVDITFHRDDFRERLLVPQIKGTEIPFSLEGKTVVLVDDVLFTGRTIRAAMDTLNAFGRANVIQLAVLVDRGHRELPIRADFVGKNIPTHEGEHVSVLMKEIDKKDAVILTQEQV